jgi:hypothetical protein
MTVVVLLPMRTVRAYDLDRPSRVFKRQELDVRHPPELALDGLQPVGGSGRTGAYRMSALLEAELCLHVNRLHTAAPRPEVNSHLRAH